QTHHTLMNYLNLPLNVIFRARLKLEGIGLLKTYQIKNEEQNVYLYELYSPYDSKRFFEEVLLVELLFHHVGERKFKRLKEIYSNKKEMTENKNITAKFNDIFSTIVPVDDQVNPNILLDQREEPFAVQFDFEEFRLTLEQQMIPSEKV